MATAAREPFESAGRFATKTPLNENRFGLRPSKSGIKHDVRAVDGIFVACFQGHQQR